MRRETEESEFYKDFTFVSSVADYQRDTWDDVLKYLKPKRSINLSETIARVRLEEKEKRKVGNDIKELFILSRERGRRGKEVQKWEYKVGERGQGDENDAELKGLQ